MSETDISVIIPVETTGNDQIESHKGILHNGKLVNKVVLSPNGNYLVTYSQEDCSIVGWNVGDIDEGQLKPDVSVKINTDGVEIDDEIIICVSDDKIVACHYKLRLLLRYICK